MDQDEGTREELNHQVVKSILKDQDVVEKLNSTRGKKPKYSQKKDKQHKPSFSDKKRVKFKERLEDIVLIESFKAYNQKMCFDDYKENIVTSTNKCCKDSGCIIF